MSESKTTVSKRERTTLDDNKLQEATFTLTKMKAALNDVIDGMSMRAACQKYGLDYISTRNVLLTLNFQRCRLGKPVMELESVTKLNTNGIEKLYMDIFGLTDITEIALPPDYEQTLLSILRTLPGREQKIIRLRYGLEGEAERTLAEIGEEIGVVAERVRAIEAKTLRTFRSFSEQLVKGNIRYYAEKQAERNKIAAYKREMEIWVRENSKENPCECVKITAEMISIDDMDLSVRTYNCLKSAGKNTLRDVLSMGDNDMMRIRNMGKKSMAELKERRAEMAAEIMHRQELNHSSNGAA